MGITKPDTYVHPKKCKPPTHEIVTAETSEQTVSETTGGAGGTNKKKKGMSVSRPNVSSTRGEERVQLRLIISPPVSGQLEIFDQMIKANYPSNKAVLGLLKKGFPKFEADRFAGKIKVSEDELATKGKAVDTTKAVSPKFLRQVKELYDPFDVLSERALGQCVAEAILRSVAKEATNG